MLQDDYQFLSSQPKESVHCVLLVYDEFAAGGAMPAVTILSLPEPLTRLFKTWIVQNAGIN
jgi:hypothetical protein